MLSLTGSLGERLAAEGTTIVVTIGGRTATKLIVLRVELRSSDFISKERRINPPTSHPSHSARKEKGERVKLKISV